MQEEREGKLKAGVLTKDDLIKTRPFKNNDFKDQPLIKEKSEKDFKVGK